MTKSKHSQGGDTRERLLKLLCGADRTIRELAHELGLSANGVRDHLARLSAEALVDHRVVRRGVGKPAHEYCLTDKGSLHISRAYLPLLSGILSVLDAQDRVGSEETLLRRAGRVLAQQRPRPEGPLRSRAEAAVNLLESLGGIAALREENDELWIRGTCCPLRALIPDHPLACSAIEDMLTELIGVPVRQQCDKHAPPHCGLLIGAAAER